MPAPFVLIDSSLADVASGAEVPLPDDARHHLSRVLRLRDDAAIEVSDGAGHRADAVLTSTGARLLGDPVVDGPPRPAIHVLQGLPRGRKHDDVVRMLTELGVDRVTAVVAERTQSPPDTARSVKLTERWRAVARGASEQARRSRLPQVDGPVALPDALADLDGSTLVLAAHLGATTDPLDAVAGSSAQVVTVAVGPEGGWSPAEADGLRSAGAVLVSLGSSVLRTEHAAMVLATVALAGTGRMASPARPWD